MSDYANPAQLTLILDLYKRNNMKPDVEYLASLTKREATQLINELLGRPVADDDALDATLLRIARMRNAWERENA